MSEFFHIFLYEKIPSRRELGQIPLADADIVAVESYMEYWPNILKMSITYSQPGDLLYVIKTHWSGEALQVIAGEKVGWIIPRHWMHLEEMRK